MTDIFASTSCPDKSDPVSGAPTTWCAECIEIKGFENNTELLNAVCAMKLPRDNEKWYYQDDPCLDLPSFLTQSFVEVHYGKIEDWDVSQVTNVIQLFSHTTEFNADLSKWDVSSVTDMYWMVREMHCFL